MSGFPSHLSPELVSVIEQELPQGEQMLAVVEQVAAPGLRPTAAWCATNRSLWQFQFRWNLSVGVKVLNSIAYSYAKIESVRSQRFGGIVQKPKMSLSVTLNSGTFLSLQSKDPEWVETFLATLQSARSSAALGGGGGVSVADELARLGELKGQGLLSDGDWERAKDLFLGKEPDERQKAITNLRQLHELHKSGVLSESEFNTKKWDILSRTR